METCKRKVLRNKYGFNIKEFCGKTVLENGLCHHHLKRQAEKQIKWGDRPNYRAATPADLESNRSMKMKDTNFHVLYRSRKGVIQKFYKDNWEDTTIENNYLLFCVTKP